MMFRLGLTSARGGLRHIPSLVVLVATFVAIGIMAGVGHYFLTIAFSQAPASVIAPFNYVQLIGAAILGYLVFDSIPDFWTWVGAAVIVCSGLYLGHAERLRYRRLANKI